MLEQTPTPKLQSKKQANLKGQVSFKSDRRSLNGSEPNSIERSQVSPNKAKSSRVLLNGSNNNSGGNKQLNSPSVSNVDKSNNDKSNNDRSNNDIVLPKENKPTSSRKVRKEFSKTIEDTSNRRVMFSDDQESEDFSSPSKQ